MLKKPKKSVTVSTTTAEEKARLRAQIRNQLAGLPAEQRTAEDDTLFPAFLSLPETAQAQTIFLFCGMGNEPDTARLFAPLLARDKRICLPRMLPGRQMAVHQYQPDRPLVKHPFGILEPDEGCPLVEIERIDLVLVPALCYDRLGFRLGMGGGYYDRWLTNYHGFTVGLCRQSLLQDQLPAEPHDHPVDVVVTPFEVIHTK